MGVIFDYKVNTKIAKKKGKFVFFNILIYLCGMEEVNEFLEWAKGKRKSFDDMINKLEEKIEPNEEDLAFIEEAYIAYEEGKL